MSKIISVCGHNGSGKTTIVTNLAHSLASKGKIVGIVSTDLSYPALVFFMGMNVVDTQPNLANICLSAVSDLRDISSYFMPVPKYKNIFVLTVANNTNCLQFADIHLMDSQVNARQFYMQLSNSEFDYIIVDCTNDVNNLLSTYALYYSEYIIHTIVPSLKGLAFFNSYEFFFEKMRNKAYNNPIIHVSNADKNHLGISQFESLSGIKFDVNLPYEAKALVAENEGIPLLENYSSSLFGSKYPKYFNKLTDKILKADTVQKGGGK